ncbi:MAG: DUF538 domain-containing protein [Myxococcales bacterium]|nr:DUF538 domain-containing protein [Myxococcales bacterium]
MAERTETEDFTRGAHERDEQDTHKDSDKQKEEAPPTDFRQRAEQLGYYRILAEAGGRFADALEKIGLPIADAFRDAVKGFRLDTSGRFELTLAQPVHVSTADGARLTFGQYVKGTLGDDRLEQLEGVQVESAEVNGAVDRLVVDGDELDVSTGTTGTLEIPLKALQA